MQKYIFFDIDGTLVSEEGFLPESAVQAIRTARNNGCKTFINTGRTAMNVDDCIREIGFDGFIYGCGTQIDWGGETIFHLTQTPARSREITQVIRESGVSVLYECCDAIYYDKHALLRPGLVRLLEVYDKKGTPFSTVPDDPEWCFDKFVIWYDADSDLKRFMRGIRWKFRYIDRENGFAELVPRGCSKGKAMEQLLEHLGAAKEQVYAIGDSLNDREMLEIAGTAIAMKGGTKLYRYADYITDELHQDGIAKALRHFGLQ